MSAARSGPALGPRDGDQGQGPPPPPAPAPPGAPADLAAQAVGGRMSNRQALRVPVCALVLLCLGLGGVSSGPLAAPVEPLAHAGRWITDTSGRVIVLHGVNMVNKFPPY